MKLHLVLIILMVVATACENHKLKPETSLVFGEAYGFCAEDCAHFYQINDQHLLKDNIERYESTLPGFDSTPLSTADYELAKPLLVGFPAYLLDNINQTFGCPDCADQGGIHIFYTAGANAYFWHIDANVDNQPPEIRDYLKQMRDVIAELKD